jgi:GNAT superfamily N-acetyltransferase
VKTAYVSPCGNCRITLKDMGDDDWMIVYVNTLKPHRRQGLARQQMARVTADADREEVTLMLDVGDGFAEGMSKRQLIRWYERLGFTQYTGRRMVRELLSHGTLLA